MSEHEQPQRNSLCGRRVLVTGASGFIGSEVVNQLVQAGASVRALTHYRSELSLHNLERLSYDVLDQVEVVRGDVVDPYFCRSVTTDSQIVFHLAALVGIPYSYVAPNQYVATNVMGTVNMLEACRSADVERIVHVSTSECYGTAQFVPMTEAHPMQGQSPYAASKIGADALVDSYFRSFGVPAVTIRPFNTYGPRQSRRAVVPTIVGQLLSRCDPLRLGSLEPVRDFTYVDDTAAGILAGGVVTGIEGKTFHLGTGDAVAIGDLVERLMSICAWEPRIVTESRRVRPERSEVLALISDNSRAVKLLGWRPTVDLATGLCRTVDFFRRFPELLTDATSFGV